MSRSPQFATSYVLHHRQVQPNDRRVDGTFPVLADLEPTRRAPFSLSASAVTQKKTVMEEMVLETQYA